MIMCDKTAAQERSPTAGVRRLRMIVGQKDGGSPVMAADTEPQGLHRLAGAMLIQAIADLGCGSQTKSEDALRWINDPSEGEFSFVFCCRLLGRDPDRVRRLLEHQKLAELRRSC